MPARCPICGKANSACGEPTTLVYPPVDQVITGVKVAGNQLVPDLTTAAMPPDMTDEEREEWQMMSAAMSKRSLRQQLRETEAQAMAEGKAPHTMLSYVDRGDGILVKMHPDVAAQYVEQNEGASIVREGALPVTKEGEVIGATKASVGEMFNADGTQKDDVQPMTSRTFNADMRVRNEATSPPIGGSVENTRDPSASSTTTSDADKGTQTRPSVRKPAASE